MGSGQAWRHGGRRRRGSLAWWCLRRRTRNGLSGLSGLFLASGLGGSEGGMLQACAERRHRRCTARSSRGSPAHLRLMPHHPRRIECSPACEKCWTQSAIPSSPGPSPHLLHAHPRRASSPPHTTLHPITPHYTTLHHPHPTKPNGGQFSPLIVHRSRGRQRTPDKTSGGARLPLGPTRGSSLRAGH